MNLGVIGAGLSPFAGVRQSWNFTWPLPVISV